MASVLEWRNSFWPFILLLCGLAFFAPLFSKEESAKGLPWVGGIVLLMFYLVLPIAGWFSPKLERDAEVAYKQSPRVECTKSRPCTSLRRADGKIEEVRVEEGKSLCFDSTFQANFAQLGYATSFRGVEKTPGCTAWAPCDSDAFWFKPKNGVQVPKYWFVPYGSARC